MAENKVVLLSGGIDSFVCAHMATKLSDKIEALYIDYGQHSHGREIIAAKKQLLS